VKLKIEFWILNQLTAMASRNLRSSNLGVGSEGYLEESYADTAIGTVTSSGWGGGKRITSSPIASPGIQQLRRNSFPFALDQDEDLRPTPQERSFADLTKPPSLRNKDSKLSNTDLQDIEKPESSRSKTETEHWQIPR
jgi:hypothetical protein